MNLYFIVYSFARIMDKYLIRKPCTKKKKKFLGKIFRNTLGKIPGVVTAGFQPDQSKFNNYDFSF